MAVTDEKFDKLDSLPIVPEEFEAELLERVDFSAISSEMSECERRFINGLIRYFRPVSILEIGISTGGGSVVILNAIRDLPQSRLLSIDCSENCPVGEKRAVGSDVEVVFDNAPDQWQLVTGEDPSIVMDSCSKTFDFAIIDTEHKHPVESLNFLCILPFLRDGSIVVFHDISLFTMKNRETGVFDAVKCLAPRIAMSSLAGGKLFPKTKSVPFISEAEPVSNIGAIQITPDTRKYISNMFQALALPWEHYPAGSIKKIRRLLGKHYEKPLLEQFDEAAGWYSAWLNSGKRTFSLKQINDSFRNNLSDGTVFYGAGKNMKSILSLFDTCGIPFSYRIWDINAESIKSLGAHKVNAPDFETRVSGLKAVITIGDDMVAEYVKAKLEAIGFGVINGIAGLIEYRPNFYTDAVPVLPVEYGSFEKDLICKIVHDGLSMVSRAGLIATLSACKYAMENNVDGDFAECGVWRGGNALIAAAVFKHYGSKKKVWLYDTFEGFVGIAPSVYDVDPFGKRFTDDDHSSCQKLMYDPSLHGNSLADVKASFEKYGLLGDNVVFVKGDVLETLNSENTPDKVAVLRLDTDFYESTRMELETLYPRLSMGGVLIVDDYGFCAGCKTAVDEYFEKTPKPLMQYVDHSIRQAVKIL